MDVISMRAFLFRHYVTVEKPKVEGQIQRPAVENVGDFKRAVLKKHQLLCSPSVQSIPDWIAEVPAFQRAVKAKEITRVTVHAVEEEAEAEEAPAKDTKAANGKDSKKS
jgi:hypothetical protein